MESTRSLRIKKSWHQCVLTEASFGRFITSLLVPFQGRQCLGSRLQPAPITFGEGNLNVLINRSTRTSVRRSRRFSHNDDRVGRSLRSKFVGAAKFYWTDLTGWRVDAWLPGVRPQPMDFEVSPKQPVVAGMSALPAFSRIARPIFVRVLRRMRVYGGLRSPNFDLIMRLGMEVPRNGIQ